MGGCRCVYRRCENSTSVTPGLHYFHFPVRDPPRCDQWITNAHKPAFRDLEKDKLRNKVICSLHFEEKCFTNEKHDRLIHSAVPTLGFDDDISPENMQQEKLNQNNIQFQNMSDDIMLIPIDEDNTNFALPNVDFPGMSYTIFDDAVIPTSKIEDVIMNELKNPTAKTTKDQQIKSVVKQIQTNLPTLKRGNVTPRRKEISHVTFINQNNDPLRTEVKIECSNIPSYSVSTLNGNVSLEPSQPTHILPDVMNEELPEPAPQVIPQSTQSETFSLELKNADDYTMSITPVRLLKNSSNEKQQESNVLPDSQQTNENQIEEEEEEGNLKYLKQIRKNTRQIRQLKKVVRKQGRFNKMIWQRKQMPHFKKKFNRTGIIKTLKDYIQPSLLAILKLELLPAEEIILEDQEEKFITDLYNKYPNCYDILRKKFNWNLPYAEKNHEIENPQCN